MRIITLLITFLAIFSSQRVLATGLSKTHSGDKKLLKNMKNIIKNLYNLSNLADLSRFGVKVDDVKKIDKPVPIMGRAGNLNIMKSAAIIATDPNVIDATPGKCDPKPVCISNPLTVDLNSNQLPFPPCINIHSDGCCPTNEKCVPIKSHEVKLQKVGIITFEGENNGKYEDRMVTVSNHTECQCQCQWETDDDCRKLNKNYIKSEYACECECPEELSCDAFHEFDRGSCSCKCRKDKFFRLEQNCRLKGFYWNDLDCRCEVRSPLANKEIKVSKNNL